ncbi:hypothetical protein CLV24_13439 [Pontibacter ummariensis]|uniref:Uncharacterized protein n=1 Tax=Pontibacter ummariensis TaxID=1610492 RepID=A0A239L1J6_9BACT|nr:hypothetical protein [Pontibacter ummariensis]PRY04633.1 hypothetical protein CLV24_13439 [Pontibacter ummariensis]SNT23788.1 hypothetical protein SAMN06296052_1344 [Pontibacter ummariensis]
MKLIDQGLTPTKALISCLEDYFEPENLHETERRRTPRKFELIENIRGRWTIGFEGVPDPKVLVCIFAFFETDQCRDGISKLIFNHGTPEAVTFEDVAGSLRGEFGETMAQAISFAAKEAKKRSEEDAVPRFYSLSHTRENPPFNLQMTNLGRLY